MVYPRARNIGEPTSPWAEFLSTDPAFAECRDWVGDWEPGDKELRLDGYYTAAQLRAMADYMETHTKKETET